MQVRGSAGEHSEAEGGKYDVSNRWPGQARHALNFHCSRHAKIMEHNGVERLIGREAYKPPTLHSPLTTVPQFIGFLMLSPHCTASDWATAHFNKQRQNFH